MLKSSANSAFSAVEAGSSWASAPPAKRSCRAPRALLSEGLVALYHRCSHGRFVYDGGARPRRCLTKGGPGPNARQDMVLFVGDVLRGGSTRATYVVEDLLGSGTFGQVVRCKRELEGHASDLVAVKVVRSKPAYSRQGMVEIELLEHLNKADAEDKHHVARMYDYFICKGHVCIVFELLSVNLYELLKSNAYRGLSTTLVRVFISQLLDALMLLRRNSIIHCDLSDLIQPENILLASAAHPLIKLIDFGSACYENHTSFSYIQSRFYRAPEVLLGLPYASEIDAWSLGCILAELYLGLPLFAGTSELSQLRLISELGPFPPHMLLAGTKVRRFFDVDGLSFTLKTDAQFAAENNVPIRKPNRRYFEFSSLEQLVMRYPQPATEADKGTRQALAHLLGGLLNLDPMERWTPAQAVRHPFLTGEPWDASWRPARRAMGLCDDSSTPSPRSSAGTSAGSTPRCSRSSSDPVGESPPRRTAAGTLPFPEGPALSSSSSGRIPKVAESDSESEEDAAQHNAETAGVGKSRPVAVPQQRRTQQQQPRKQHQPMLGMTPSERKAK